ncbi:MAG TPA: DNRLRE domain-containing protein [Gemmataceae bacterium]|nr:DNRLRE domain-containing protein [Gemmataceae bacterium]
MPRTIAACVFTFLSVGLAGAAGPEKMLFDFEDPVEIAAWSNLALPNAKEPAVKAEQSTDHATSGRHSLKVTFAGGNWPTLATANIPDDWMPWETFRADVTVSRTCVVGFTVMQEGSIRGGDWDGAVSRWCTTAILPPGKHTVSAPLHPNGWSAIRPKLENGKALGKCVSLEFFVYHPHDGESVFIDNIRLSAAKEPQPTAKTEFRVLGTDLTVSGVQDLGKKLADKWKQPEPLTVEQAEAAFRSRFADLKKTHPKAVLAVFRDGEAGFDPSNPARVYSGWKDAYWSSHGPDAMTLERATNYGKSATQEVFMRHRSPLFRVDLASIPKGSDILAAKFLLVRAGQYGKDQHPNQPNMWVAEACNRPWDEYDVNAYQFAKDKFWRSYGGMHWAGDDPDFLPIYLAHGPGREGCNVWDFTEAVRFWTAGKHENHGFMLHGDSKDWFKAWFHEAEHVKNRPALLVVYEPR